MLLRVCRVTWSMDSPIICPRLRRQVLFNRDMPTLTAGLLSCKGSADGTNDSAERLTQTLVVTRPRR